MTPIAITLTGITPLLCGRPVPGGQAADAADPRSQAAARLYMGAGGQPVIPGLNLYRSLTGAARLIGRCPVELVHSLGIAEREISIRTPATWTVDTRMVRQPESGERGICHRPRFDAWSLDATLLVDLEALAAVDVRSLVEAAGIRIGIGDFRPERGGPFGRFAVAAWEALS